MSDTVISGKHLSKTYRPGQIGTGIPSHDLNVSWYKIRVSPVCHRGAPRRFEQGNMDRHPDGPADFALKTLRAVNEEFLQDAAQGGGRERIARWKNRHSATTPPARLDRSALP
jgi:hypothetical protein